MSIWTRALSGMLRRTGEVWTTSIDGECVSFNAIYEQQNTLEDASGQTVIVAGSVITVLTSVANDFTFKQELRSPTDDLWYVREVLKVDDGHLSRVHIVESLTNTEC